MGLFFVNVLVSKYQYIYLVNILIYLKYYLKVYIKYFIKNFELKKSYYFDFRFYLNKFNGQEEKLF